MPVEDEAETKKFGLVPKQTPLAHGAPSPLTNSGSLPRWVFLGA
jgi:hypothetical protein